MAQRARVSPQTLVTVFGFRPMSGLPRLLLIDENKSDRELASLVLAGEFGELEIDGPPFEFEIL